LAVLGVFLTGFLAVFIMDTSALLNLKSLKITIRYENRPKMPFLRLKSPQNAIFTVKIAQKCHFYGKITQKCHFYG
jgi:hypothetical protein